MYITKSIISGFRHIRLCRILRKAIKEDEIIVKLSHIFGVQFRKDWVGRIYAIINPAVKDGKFSPEQIFEYGDQGYNNDSYIRMWTFERLSIMDSFLKSNNLFDIMTYEIRKVDDYGNHLFILIPITLPVWKSNLSAAWKELAALVVLGFITYFGIIPYII